VTALRTLLSRLQALVRSDQMDRDLDDEIAGHLAEAADEYIRQGLSPEEAHRAARRSFGGVLQVKEVHRQVRSFGWLDNLKRDLRFAARILTKDRWVTLAAVAMLATGIAANTTAFAIVNTILLRDLPFDQPDRVVAIGVQGRNVRTLTGGVSYADFRDWRAAAKSFAGLGAMSETTMNVADTRGAPERYIGSYISANAFGLLGQQPMLGRDLSADDERPAAVPVVILGHTLWRNRYGSDPGVLGRTIRVNGVSSVVIGVMPENFGFPARSRLWQPLALLPEAVLASRGARQLSAFGRLAPGVGMAQAVAELRGIAAALAERYPGTNRDLAPLVAAYHERSVGSRGRSILPVLMGVVACVLLMACANVANLLLVRAAARSHEISIRMAIGAGRAQIVRQMLVESLLLAMLAGAAGWGLSLFAIRGLSGALSVGEVSLPYWITFTLDRHVFAFSIGICLATALLFGLVPALQTSKPGIANVLTETGRAAAGTVRTRRWANGLVIFQLALTPVLLTGGGLMMRGIVAQYEMDAGVDTGGIVWARVDLPPVTYPAKEDRVRFYQQLDERLARMPGAVAGIVSNTPFGGGAARNLWRDDEEATQQPRRARVLVVTTGPRYFETFRKSLIRGSELPLLETQRGTPSIILNEWLAATVFPGEDPIGRRICLTAPSDTSSRPEWFSVAGVAPNIRQNSTQDASGRDGVAFVSYGSNPLPGAGIVARSASDPSGLAAVLREQVRAIDPDLPLFEVMPLDDRLASSDERVGLRVFGTMFVVFAVVALLLAAVGLYAVTAYAAAQRTREIGLRVALGAQRSQIWWLVTRRAAWQLGTGLSIGMVGALGMGQLLGSVLVGIEATDAATLTGVAGLLAAVGLCACLVPARRAMRVDPSAVLRSE